MNGCSSTQASRNASSASAIVTRGPRRDVQLPAAASGARTRSRRGSSASRGRTCARAVGPDHDARLRQQQRPVRRSAATRSDIATLTRVVGLVGDEGLARRRGLDRIAARPRPTDEAEHDLVAATRRAARSAASRVAHLDPRAPGPRSPPRGRACAPPSACGPSSPRRAPPRASPAPRRRRGAASRGRAWCGDPSAAGSRPAGMARATGGRASAPNGRPPGGAPIRSAPCPSRPTATSTS